MATVDAIRVHVGESSSEHARADPHVLGTSVEEIYQSTGGYLTVEDLLLAIKSASCGMKTLSDTFRSLTDVDCSSAVALLTLYKGLEKNYCELHNELDVLLDRQRLALEFFDGALMLDPKGAMSNRCLHALLKQWCAKDDITMYASYMNDVRAVLESRDVHYDKERGLWVGISPLESDEDEV